MPTSTGQCRIFRIMPKRHNFRKESTKNHKGHKGHKAKRRQRLTLCPLCPLCPLFSLCDKEMSLLYSSKKIWDFMLLLADRCLMIICAKANYSLFYQCHNPTQPLMSHPSESVLQLASGSKHFLQPSDGSC